MRYPKKVFFIDNSFLTNISLRFSKDYAKLCENLVAIELKRVQAKNPFLELYYWRDSTGKEVDFVLKEGMNNYKVMN